MATNMALVHAVDVSPARPMGRPRPQLPGEASGPGRLPMAGAYSSAGVLRTQPVELGLHLVISIADGPDDQGCVLGQVRDEETEPGRRVDRQP
jgi:hypothetical protein